MLEGRSRASCAFSSHLVRLSPPSSMNIVTFTLFQYAGAPHVRSAHVPIFEHCSPLSPAAGAQKSPDDVVIVSAFRTPIGKAKRGSFKVPSCLSNP